MNLISLEQEIQEVASSNNFFLLRRGMLPSGQIHLDFAIQFEHKREEDTQYIPCEGEVRLVLPQNYPSDWPHVFDLKGNIDPKFHVYNDKSLCLGSNLWVSIQFSSRPTILGFLENCVAPYYFSFFHFLKYGKMPYGELKHNTEDLLNSYKEILQVDTPQKILNGLQLLKNYRGHHLCYCDSGKRVRNCHLYHLKGLINIPRYRIESDMKTLNPNYESKSRNSQFIKER